MLREAEALMLRAADLVDDALHMSGVGVRADGISETMRDIASGPGDSLRNIARDLETLEEDPGWSRPLVSPKHLFGDQ